MKHPKQKTQAIIQEKQKRFRRIDNIRKRKHIHKTSDLIHLKHYIPRPVITN